MEIRVLQGFGSTFRTPDARVAQVLFNGMGDGQSHVVHCQFPSEEEEREFVNDQPNLDVQDLADIWMHLGGTGMATVLEKETGARIEILGAVRDLAPMFRQIADAFEARLAELPK